MEHANGKPLAGAVVVAAGTASRMQGVNKQLLELEGVPVFIRSLQAFDKNPHYAHLVLVVRPGEEEEMQRRVERWNLQKPVTVVAGGATRQESAGNGVLALPEGTEYVAIHDGARPFVSQQVLDQCLEDAMRFQAACASIPVKDTIKWMDGEGLVAQTPPREQLRAAQTPQIFLREEYLKAYQAAIEQGLQVTDDCQLLEHWGRRVYLSQGSEENIKITTPQDIPRAQALAQTKKREDRTMRIGHGYDAHRLVADRPLILGGVCVPFELGLLGHSDADVLTHAVMDSLLGAAALGDIGTHFPDTDPQYKGADSIQLLQRVAALLKEHGYRLVNLDATILAQKPKLKPYLPQMRQCLAQALQVAVEQVSIKATTEEKMGFTGRLEGISAHCVCLIQQAD